MASRTEPSQHTDHGGWEHKKCLLMFGCDSFLLLDAVCVNLSWYMEQNSWFHSTQRTPQVLLWRLNWLQPKANSGICLVFSARLFLSCGCPLLSSVFLVLFQPLLCFVWHLWSVLKSLLFTRCVLLPWNLIPVGHRTLSISQLRWPEGTRYTSCGSCVHRVIVRIHWKNELLGVRWNWNRTTLIFDKFCSCSLQLNFNELESLGFWLGLFLKHRTPNWPHTNEIQMFVGLQSIPE